MRIFMLNKSFSYLFPLILDYDKIKYRHYVINTFLFLEGLPTDDLILAVLLKEDDSDEFLEFQEELYNSRLFDFEFTTPKGQIIVFNMEVFKLEYEKFLDGTYSNYLTSSKDIILRFLKNSLRLSKNDLEDFEGIFYKKEKYRLKLEEQLNVEISKDAELSSIYDIVNETFISN